MTRLSLLEFERVLNSFLDDDDVDVVTWNKAILERVDDFIEKRADAINYDPCGEFKSNVKETNGANLIN